MSDNIVVALRLRPLITREINDANVAKYWQIQDRNIIQVDPHTKKQINTFAFDEVFGDGSSNIEIYKTLAYPIVQAGLTGINGTIFAYGQTSSGKTFTMTGVEKDPGVIPLSIQNIFHSIENTPDREFLLRASYMEIYQENIFDLLTGTRISSLREDTTGQVLVLGLKEVCVTSEEMLLSVMADGDKRRRVGETNMNERSSRSHSIFRLIIESREREDKDCEGGVTVSHLNLVDLAGSENVSQTGAFGERLKEGGAINKSLFMLGRVISQLSDGEQFVNFRDSKLTRILQNSLGGNAKTAIVCTVTPVSREQTLSTVRFASRAKSIQNKPIVNEVLSESALLKRYAMEIKRLKLDLENERNTDRAQEVEQVREKLDQQEKQNYELQEKIRSLKEKMVVSSHSLDVKKLKDKKIRRETWAAPAIRRSFGTSVASRYQMPQFDSFHLRDTPLSNISEEKTSVSDLSSTANDSIVSFDGNSDSKEELLKQNELSKILSFDDNFLSPQMVPRRRRRRKVGFVLSQPKLFSDAQCQTENTLLPKPPFLDHQFLTPKKTMRSPACDSFTPSSPKGTPREVLRSMNQKLKEVLESKELVLKDWKEELKELEEFHRNELMLLRESFDEKMGEGFFDEKELESELKSLKKSLEDCQQVCLDANKTVSEQSNQIKEMEERVARLQEENERLSKATQQKVTTEELKVVRRELTEKKSRLEHLERDKADFDFRIELALEKQKQTEAYLRKSLNDAWEELAKYKRCSEVEAPEENSQIVKMAKDLQELKSKHEVEKSEKKDLEKLVKSLQLEIEQTKKEFLEKNWESMYTCEERSPLEQSYFTNLSIVTNPCEVSQKLCETLCYLDESVLGVSASPRKDVGINPSEILIIRQQLLDLQEMLIAQERLQQQQEQERLSPENCRKLSFRKGGSEINSHIVSQIQDSYNEEVEVIRLLESVCHDYVQYSYSENLYRQQNAELCRLESPFCKFKKSSDLNGTSIFDESLCLPTGIVYDYHNNSNVLTLADELKMAALNETGIEEIDRREDNTTEIREGEDYASESENNKDLREQIKSFQLKENAYNQNIEDLKYQVSNLEQELSLRSKASVATAVHSERATSKETSVTLSPPKSLTAEETSMTFPQKTLTAEEISMTLYPRKILAAKETFAILSPSKTLTTEKISLTLNSSNKTTTAAKLEEVHSIEVNHEDEIRTLKSQLNENRLEAQRTFKSLEDEKNSLLKQVKELKKQNGSILTPHDGSSEALNESLSFHSLSSLDDGGGGGGGDSSKTVENLEPDEVTISKPELTNVGGCESELQPDTKGERVELNTVYDTSSISGVDAETQTEDKVLSSFDVQTEPEDDIETLNIQVGSATSAIEKELFFGIPDLVHNDNFSKPKSGEINRISSLQEKASVQEKLIKTLEVELNELREREEELESMITEFTFKEEQLEEKQSEVKRKEEEIEIALEEKSQIICQLESKIVVLESQMKALKMDAFNAPFERDEKGSEPPSCCQSVSGRVEFYAQKRVDGILGEEEIRQSKDEDAGNASEYGFRADTSPEEPKGCCKMFRNKVNELIKEKQIVITDLESLRSLGSTFENEAKLLTREKEALENKIQILKLDVASKKTESEDLNSRHTSLQKELKSASSTIEMFKVEISKLKEVQALNETYQLSNQSLEGKLEEKEDSINSLQEEIQLHKSNISNLTHTVEELKVKLAQNDKKDQIIALSADIAELRQKYSEKLTNEMVLLEQIQRQEKESLEDREKVKNLSQILQRVEKENDDHCIEKNSLKDRIYKVEIEINRFGIRNLEDVANLLEKASSVSDELTLKKRECEELALKLSNMKDQKEKEFVALKSEIEHLLEQESKYEKVAKESDSVIKSLSDDIASLKTECVHYCHKITSLEKLCEEKQKDNATVRQLQLIGGELETLKDLVKEKERENEYIRNDCENVKLVLAKRGREFEEHKSLRDDELSDMRQSLQERKNELESVNEELQEKRRQMHSMEACLQSKERKCLHLEDKVKELEESLRAQLTKLEAMSKIKTDLETSLDSAKKKLVSLEIARENQISERGNLTEKLSGKEREVSSLASKCDTLKSDIDTLRTERKTILEALEESRANLQRHVDLFQSKDELIKDLEKDLEEARRTHEGCAVKEARNAMETELLLNAIEKYKVEISERESICNKQTANNRDTKMKADESLATLRKVITEKENVLEEMIKENLKMEEKNEKEIEMYQTQLKKMRENLKVLQNENEALTLNSKKKQKESESGEKLREKCCQVEDEVLKLKEEKGEILKALQETKNELSVKVESYDALSEEYDRAIEHYKERMSGFKETIRDYMTKVKTLKQEKQMLSDTLNSQTTCEPKDMTMDVTFKKDEKRSGKCAFAPSLSETLNRSESHWDIFKKDILKKQNFSLVDEIKRLKEENSSLKEALEETNTRLNTLRNVSITKPSWASSSNASASDTDSRPSNKKLSQKIERLNLKVLDLQIEVDTLRRSENVIGSNEELEKQLEWMRKEINKTEKLNERLNKNYDLLEEEIAQMEEQNKNLREKLAKYEGDYDISSHSPKQGRNDKEILTEKLDANCSRNVREQEVQTEANKGTPEKDLRERVFEFKRENNILKLKLDALNAPAQKEAQRLKEELQIEQNRNKKLMMELRRVQNMNSNDLSLIERNPPTTKKDQINQEQREMASCGFGSQVVLDVQIMGLKNINYHLEKEVERMKKENEVLKEHVKHYKSKSDEWKTKCHKEMLKGKHSELDKGKDTVRTREKIEVKAPLRERSEPESNSSKVKPVSKGEIEPKNSDCSSVTNQRHSGTKIRQPPTTIEPFTSNIQHCSTTDTNPIHSRHVLKSPQKQFGKENKFSNFKREVNQSEHSECKTQ